MSTLATILEAPVPLGSVCALHPERPANVACERCGTFLCFEDRRRIDRRTFCPSCFARPEVNYLEAFRLKHWGKRDVWAYAIGFGGLVNLGTGIGTAFQSSLTFSAVAIGVIWSVLGLIGIGFFFRMRWTRWALMIAPAGPILIMLAVSLPALVGAAPAGRDTTADVLAPVIGVTLFMLVPLLFAVRIFFDTRNRLFFRVDVPETALRKAWHLYSNNTVARSGFQLSLLGLLIPGVAVIAAIFSWVGLRRVDPKGMPPVGRKGQAIAGLCLSGVGVLMWSAIAVASQL